MGLGATVNVLGLPERIEGMGAFEVQFARALELVESSEEVRSKVNTMQVGNPAPIQAVPDVATWVDEMVAGANAKAAKWLANTVASVDGMKAAALTSGKRYADGVQEAIRDDRFTKGVQQIDTGEVRATLQNVGAGGFSSGVSNRKGKITQAIAKLQPKVAALKQTINNMPQDTDGQREQRLLAARKGMIAIGKT